MVLRGVFEYFLFKLFRDVIDMLCECFVSTRVERCFGYIDQASFVRLIMLVVGPPTRAEIEDS